jgi:hypothetical protein
LWFEKIKLKFHFLPEERITMRISRYDSQDSSEAGYELIVMSDFLNLMTHIEKCATCCNGCAN